MQRSRFLSIISVTLVVASLLGACGDDTCGPGDAPDVGILASSADVTLKYGTLFSGQNNDCPDPAAPAGVVSVTIQGSQQDGTGLLTLCVGRPDLLAAGPIPLGTAGARIIDMNGDDAAGCMYAFDSSRPVAGTVSSKGLCDNGADAAGYALTVDGNVSLKRTCTTTIDTIAVSFQGTAAVSVP
jgi:hypothetical protein